MRPKTFHFVFNEVARSHGAVVCFIDKIEKYTITIL